MHEKEASIRVCHIQASKVVVAGYLQESTETSNEEHWTEHLNVLPRLQNLDVEVQIRNIEDPTSDTQEPGYKIDMSRNKCLAAHVLCSEKMRKRSTLRYATRTAKIGPFLEQLVIFPKDKRWNTFPIIVQA